MRVLVFLMMFLAIISCGDDDPSTIIPRSQRSVCETCESPKTCFLDVKVYNRKHPDIPYDYRDFCLLECDGYFKEGKFEYRNGYCTLYEVEE